MALDHTILAGIEHDLRTYRRWQARREQLQEQLASVHALVGRVAEAVVGSRGFPGDPTGRYVQRIMDLRAEIDRLEVRIRRVELALEAMTPEQRRLVERYYFEGRPREWVQREMGLSRSGFYRLRSAALETYAYVAGLDHRLRNRKVI